MNAIFQRLYYYYFYFCLTIIFLALYPLLYFYLRNPQKHFKAHNLRRKGCRLLLFTTGIKPKVIRKNITESVHSDVYVITPNHTSNLDIFTMLAVVPGYYCFMAKAELLKIPLFNITFKMGLDITVERGNTEQSIKAYKQSVQAIKSGKSIVIFPEGGIFADPYFVNEFKDGAFSIAIKQKVAVWPISLPDNHICLPDEEKRAKAGKIRIILHETVPTANLQGSDTEMLKNQVYEIISAEIKKNEHR
jgi:1-acyl-sn-glycerol-3-phosphate acyltransferase